jgi:nucleotide-binding universal stress UspA family protein
MIKVKNVLVPIDFSTNSDRAFGVGHCLAKLNNAKLHLIHVIDPSYYKVKQRKISDREFIRKIRFENAKEELRKFKLEVPHSDIEIIEVLIEGIPHKEILSYAKQNDIDMIVIISHGWTNLPNMLMGKTANKIMLQANIQVICIKSNLSVIKNRAIRKQKIKENWNGQIF